MSELDKCLHADKNNFDSKEGEQRRLSSNNVSTCSSSLGVDEIDAQNVSTNTNAILTPKTIEIFTGFAATLKRIHIRLVMEGYTIKDGKIYKPGEYQEHDANNEHNSRDR